ncbi:hypothetical protein L2E82_24473 [Cichorium intybus]|uniref:Uncharacterized protein n=1 Tax=Cichorium intybus TaxID=13427 RepID=A0ACB9E1X7_CICIN|nr:hypothetical protein L2E82_24473 [Cichorium intybus]
MHESFYLLQKGTLKDTIRTVEGYSDIIVMRHFESGTKRAVMTGNAGNGPDQHPTQFWGKNEYTNVGLDEVSED